MILIWKARNELNKSALYVAPRFLYIDSLAMRFLFLLLCGIYSGVFNYILTCLL